jgi:hypothetical protein
MEMHVHGFGAFWLNFLVHHPFCRGVVGLDWGSWLLMTHLGEYLM